MQKKICFFLLLIPFLRPVSGQDLGLYEKHSFVHDGDTLPWRLLLPENYDPGKKYPLILFLHGAGERGSDNEKQLVHGGRLFLKPETRKNFPAIVVFPQCPANHYWSNVNIQTQGGRRIFNFLPGGEATRPMQSLIALIGYLLDAFPVKKKQVYVGGLSMGGMGTFEIVRRLPKLFAAAFPICGGAEPSTAKKIRKTKWWVFHGGKDDIVPPVHSEKMVDALKQEGAKVKFTLYPNANHNSWDSAFAEPGLLPWLFSQRK